MSARPGETLQTISRLLQHRSGLNPATLGTHGILDATRARMAICGCRDIREYLDLLRNNEGEMQSLIEQVAVPESWFFRDVQPFECLRHYVREVWRARQIPPPLRVLSLPCGNGEEACSLAMTLMDLGLRPGESHLDAGDISRQALQRARGGTYRRSSFREKDPASQRLLTRYGTWSSQEYTVDKDVERHIHYFQANLVSPTLLAGALPYQVIFCRNLFIYLDAEARRAALTSLRRLLDPAGLLYVGHVEAAVPPVLGFRAYHQDFPFAFTRGDAPVAQTMPAPSPRPVAVPPMFRSPLQSSPVVRQLEPLPEPMRAILTTPVRNQALLAQAREAADRGQLTEAGLLCAQMLEQSVLNPDAFYLLAVVRVAEGSLAEAEAYLQRALYLAPEHPEALVYLRLLKSGRGDQEQADRLRRRAERLFLEGGPV